MNFTWQHRVILPVLLFSVIASGFPKIEFHTHADAQPGHAHVTHDHDEPDGHHSENLDEPGNIGVTHTHDISGPSLTLISAFNLNVATRWRTDERFPLPVAKPPDRVIPPLYRPPIV